MINIHESVYKLNADPFRLSPDHRFAYSHRSYARSKAYLDYALLQGEGFVMVTGAAGTGKTTLIKEILANIDITSVQVATLTSTQLRARDLLQMVATAFGLRFAEADKATLLTALEQFLQQQCQSRRRAVLIVDEAQGLSVSALEELRLLANLQHDNQMLLQVFLLGQEKLRDLISTPGMEQLRQRVVASSHLEPLSVEDTVNYVQYRLVQAGWQGDPEIGGDALQLIHTYSGGVPRRINLICTRLLLSGAMRDKHILDGQDARDVILELQQEMLIDPGNAETQLDVVEEPMSPKSLTRDIAPEKESPDDDKSRQPSQAKGSAGRVDNVTKTQHPSTPESSGGPREGKVSARDSARKNNSKRRIKRQKQELSAPELPEIEDVPEDDAAQSGYEQPQMPSSSEIKIDKDIGRIGQYSPAMNRSISMAAARAAPISEGRWPDVRLTPTPPESGSPGKYAAARPRSVNHRPAVKTAKRAGRSLRMQLVVFLLAVGPLAAVVGANYRDYMITVSAQVDKTGMIRRFTSDVDYVRDNSDEPVAKIPSENTNSEQDNYRLTSIPLKLADSRNYIGSTMLVKTRGDISEKEYRLIGVSPDSLELSQGTGSKATAFRILNSEIENIRVLIEQRN